MSYTLIGSLTSPFVRKIRLACHGKLDIEFKAINYLEEKDAAYLQSVNPINKLPILIDGEQKIYDSRVIYNYLSKKHGWTPLSLEDENRLSAIDGAADTSVNLFSLKRAGLDINMNNWYLQRQRERIPSIFQYLSPWVRSLDGTNPKHWNYPTMSLYSYVYWGQFRQMLNLEPYPEYQRFLKDFSTKPGIRETDIPN